MADSNETIFGSLTQAEVVDGLHAEVAGRRMAGLAMRLGEVDENELGQAINDVLVAQSEYDVIAHINLTLARLEEARTLATQVA